MTTIPPLVHVAVVLSFLRPTRFNMVARSIVFSRRASLIRAMVIKTFSFSRQHLTSSRPLKIQARGHHRVGAAAASLYQRTRYNMVGRTLVFAKRESLIVGLVDKSAFSLGLGTSPKPLKI